MRLLLLLHLPLLLALQLIRPSQRNIFRLVIRERVLEALLNDIAACIIEDHGRSEHPLKLARERHKLELFVDFGDEFGGAGEGDAGDKDETPVHAPVFADGFAEGATLVVDCEGGDLLDELQEVDGGIEERRLELFLEIDVILLGIDTLHVLGYVDECDDVDSELAEDRANDVEVEDVVLRSLFRELFYRLIES